MTTRWLAPTASVVEGGLRYDGAAIERDAAALAPRLAGHSLAVGPDSARAVAVGFRAAQLASIPLALLRAGQDPAQAGSLVLARDLSLVPGQATEQAGKFEILLRTSGTTGAPKLIRRDEADLLRRVAPGAATRWLLTYEPTAFAGLQVLFTALGTPGSTLVAAPGASIAALADLALGEQVEAISGTPTFWRAMLVALGARNPPLRLLTLGGETAEQAVLDRLAARFPGARLRHIYATTEAGAVFAVQDGRAGFPAAWLDQGVDGIALRIEDGTLRVEHRGDWIDSGDLVAVEGDRVRFVGRRDAMVKVAGVQVVPDEVERELLCLPGVADVAVRARANPITGALLEADIVSDGSMTDDALLASLRAHIASLPAPSRPRRLVLVEQVVSSSGKKARSIA